MWFMIYTKYQSSSQRRKGGERGRREGEEERRRGSNIALEYPEQDHNIPTHMLVTPPQ